MDCALPPTRTLRYNLSSIAAFSGQWEFRHRRSTTLHLAHAPRSSVVRHTTPSGLVHRTGPGFGAMYATSMGLRLLHQIHKYCDDLRCWRYTEALDHHHGGR
jgi:hypothetical protein